jgi:WS/DGAT/MGAT family acyltransferase
MSDVEAMMWNVEKDPYLNSTFGSVTILDASPDFDRLRRRLLRMVQRIPRLHQRVVPAFGRLAPPEWQDDPDFDIDYHVRHVALPAPGTDRQLLDLATQFVQDAFDRTRPLWEFLIIDGLEGGRAAMVQKMHHTITDGEGGIRMSEQFIDVTRDAPDIDEIVITAEAPPPDTNIFETAGDTFALWRPLGIAHRAVSETAGLVTHPAKLGSLPFEAIEMARSTIRQVTITDRAHSPLWAERSLRRHFEIIDVDFDDAYRAAKALGGSLNDFFVAGTAGGAGAYHRALGAEVESLRMAMPVSTRTDKAAGGNSFVPTRELVPSRDRGPRRALRRRARDPRPGQARRRSWGGRQDGRAHERAAHVGARAHGPPAGGDRGLHHLERARRALAPLHRRRPHRGELPPRPLGGHGVQPQ